MIAKTCPRLWEVEAAHVGRLDRAACANQREHQKTCGECESLARSLAELKEQLVQLVPPSDELSLRRLRRATLQRAAAEQHKRPPVRVRPRAIVIALVLAIGAGGLWFAARSSRGPLVEVTSQLEPSSWSRHHSPKLERVVLREGVFSLNVRRKPKDPRVVVEIPEGEIEDVGTTFGVTVHDGRTTRIAVTQGAVLLRRTGLPALKLLAGSVWEPVPKSPGPEVLPPTAAVEIVPVAPVSAPPAPTPHARRSVSRHAPLPPPQPSAAAPASTPADEDASYLEFVQLLREQHRDAAARVGRDYMQRFPNGFRRPDVERALLELH